MGRRTHIRIPVAGRVLSPVGSEFVSVEVLGGIVLFAATIAALTWSNLDTPSYADVWGANITIGWRELAVSEDLGHWVNDGLMTVFFFVVGLEIKRELVHGELRDPRTATLPVLAAGGGMLAPAILYAALNAGTAGARGWAIPMATDIAFAVVVLAVLGSRVPTSLRLFLLTLAIVDDIGAILVIALFYSEGLALAWLLGAFGVVGVILLMRHLKFGHPLVYLIPAVVLWLCTLKSGVHATLAGVVLGLLTPARSFGTRNVIEGLEHRLHPWSSFLVIPVFALANAGVRLDGAVVEHAASSLISLGIVVGLVVGKPLGIVLAVTIAMRLGAGRLPRGVRLPHVLGVGCAAGIGFTVSLFVAELSFTGATLADAKIAILSASIVSAAAGTGILLATGRRRTATGDVHPPSLGRVPQ